MDDQSQLFSFMMLTVNYSRHSMTPRMDARRSLDNERYRLWINIRDVIRLFNTRGAF